MKHYIFGVVVTLAVALGLVAPVSATSTDNFVITNYDVKMELSRDDDKVSTLRTTLNITADFPPEQNHGLAPIFVKEYDGHPTSFKLESVTDELGNKLEYHWNDDELRIGDADTYVSGLQTYVITYSERNVTRYYADTGKDEFYWDVIGAEWRVPIKQATVSLKIDSELVSARQAEPQCYIGLVGSTDYCYISEIDGEVVADLPVGLHPGQGVTIAIGFQPGTFSEYKLTLWEQFVQIWQVIQVVTAVLMVLGLIWLGVTYIRSTGRKKELGAIVPEYIPPEDASLLTSAFIGNNYFMIKGSPMTAQLIDLAVRHYIKIYEVKQVTFLKHAEYEIEIIKDLSNLKAEEKEMIDDMFNAPPKIGARLNLKMLQPSNRRYVKRTADDRKKIKNLAENEYRLLEKNEVHVKRFRRYGIVFLVPAILLLALPLLILVIVSFVMSHGKSLTDRGLALRRYLMGLKMYISVAEVERLQMLQSPEGAEKVGQAVDGNDKGRLVKLYERVLPYAILFGQEKSWNKQIGQYYEQAGAQPDWYSGIGAFNAANFATSMNSLNYSVTNTGNSYASSTGGSGGGGSVGGGGGGGGGGGW